MVNSYQDRSYYSSTIMREYRYGDAKDVKGGVGPRTTHLSPQKYNFGSDSNIMGYILYQRECKAPPMESSFNDNYSVGDLSGSTSCVVDCDGKGGLVPRTTHRNSQKVGCYIDGGNVSLSRIRKNSLMNHSYQNRS